MTLADRMPLLVVGLYFLLLLGLGGLSSRAFRGTSSDYFVANRSIGSVLLLLSIFGTTMTAFAMVGSTAKAHDVGIGVYGLMASSSGLVHSLVILTVGVPLWAIGKRHGFVTQVQFFRQRFESNALGTLLFVALVSLVVPYVLIGLIGSGEVIRGVTAGMFPATFPGTLDAAGQRVFAGSIPPWLTALVVCAVVLFYVFFGGLRGAAWANAFQTVVFMGTAVLAFFLIARQLGGIGAATRQVEVHAPELLDRTAFVGHGQFLTYLLVPLSLGMFPHVFQHWLTARSARSFRLTIVAHPVFILIVWLPCILIGIWAAGAQVPAPGGNSNAILGRMVALLESPVLTGLVTAGILAAIMSSLDSQFVCLGTMFSHDVVVHHLGRERFSDGALVWLGRGFIALVVAVCYALSLFPPPHIFDLAVWSFSGFTGLFPLVVAALYWRRATRAGAIASVLAMAAAWIFFFRDSLLHPPSGGRDYLVAGLLPVTFILAAAAAALVLVSWWTAPPHAATVDTFLARRGAAGARDLRLTPSRTP